MRYAALITFVLSAFMQANAKDNSLLFIENKGQVTDQFHRSRTDIDLYLNAGSMNIFICKGKILYQFAKAEPTALDIHAYIDPLSLFSPIQVEPQLVKMHRLEMELIGANANATLVKEDKQAYYENYYTPQFGEVGGHAHSYQKIAYLNVYPNIDWQLYVKDGKLEHEFIVRSGGNPNDIKIKYDGANELKLNADGSFSATTDMGTITEHAPVSIQTNGKEVKTTYILNNNILSFNIGPFSGPLIIDPYIEWATFYRGAKDLYTSTSNTVDNSNSVYLYSNTEYSSMVATVGAFDVTYNGNKDVYIAKFDENGNRTWATYFGGSQLENGWSITYDNNGSIVISGSTNSSTSIATVGADQPNFSGPLDVGQPFGGDLFLAKFNGSGYRIWATYVGGSDREVGGDLICDAIGNTFICGGANSSNSIATTGSYQVSLNGISDAYLMKYDSTGHKIWGTYFGGANSESGMGVAISGDKLYMCGTTSSNSGIATNGVHQQSLGGLNNSGYIASFDTSGAMRWGTYFHGNTTGSNILLPSVTCDVNDNVFVFGMGDDPTGITTTGCHQPVFGGNSPYGDAIIAKFNDLGQRVWATYYGGSGEENGGSIICSPNGELYVTGQTSSNNNIAYAPFQGNHAGGYYDGWIAKFSNSGVCIWGTYLGSNAYDIIGNLSLASNGYFYISAKGGALPVNGNSFLSTPVDTIDHYLAKFKDFPTGLEHLKKQSISLFPNPNNGTFSLSAYTLAEESHATIRVTDILGKLLYTTKATITSNKIAKDLTLPDSIPPGLYILKILTTTEQQSIRFVKK